MTRKQRIVVSIGVLAAVSTCGLLAAWLYIGRTGTTPLEGWIGHYLMSVIEHHITPEISFDDLDYQRPRTVVVRNLRMSRYGTQMVSVDRMLLDLAEIPREGEPVRIRHIDLEGPHLTFVTDQRGRLAGWSDFVRPDVRRDPQSVPASLRVSDVLVLRHVSIRNGELRYQGPGEQEPMVLPGIELSLDTPSDHQAPGWYAVSAVLQRAPIFKADVRGRINLDTGMLELAEAALSATLGPTQYASLPPALRHVLEQHNVLGTINATFTGAIPLNDPANTQGHLETELKEARGAIGTTSASVANLKLVSTLPDGAVRLEVSKGSWVQGRQTLFAVDRLSAELPHMPRGEWPLEVTRLEIDHPSAELIAAKEGGFVGWNDLMPSNPQERSATRPAASAPAEAAAPPNAYVRILAGEIRGGRFTYGPGGGAAPLTLQDISIRLQGPDAARSGRQPVQASAKSEELLNTTLTGTFDMAGLLLALDSFQINAQIAGEKQYALLPEAIGTLFRRHALTGGLSLDFRGTFPVAHPAQARGTATADLSQVRMHFSGLDVPVEQVHFEFQLPTQGIRADLGGLRMVSGDFPFVQVERARLELAGPPSGHGPLVVKSAVLQDPQLNFVHEADGGLRGWRNLMDPDSPWPHVSDLARFEHVQVVHGDVSYEDLDPGQEHGDVMVLTGIDLDLRTPPILDAPGWYHITTSARHDPLFDMSIDGRIHPDAMLLDLDPLTLKAVLDPKQYENLPPQIQTVLRQHEVRGTTTLKASGRLAMLAPIDSRLTVESGLSDAHIGFSKMVWPIQRVSVNAQVAQHRVAAHYDADLLGGRVSGDVNLGLAHPHPLSVTWRVGNVRMEDTLRVISTSPPKYSGQLSSQGSIRADLHDFPATLEGNGTLQVSNAQLIRLPVIRSIAALRALIHSPHHTDEASASFTLHSDHVNVSSMEVDSESLKLELSGRIDYHSTVDLDVHARIAEKIGENIGKGIGDIGGLGGLSPFHRQFERLGHDLGQGLGQAANFVDVGERAVGYRVFGPLSQPQVHVRPLDLFGEGR